MDKEKLKGYWEKVKTALGKISKKIWILLAVVLVVIVAAAIFIYNNRPYAVLVDGATDSEIASVTRWLTEQGVTDWKMQNGAILVPEGHAATLKARLLQEQYSSANVTPSGYFERVGALSTMYDREMATKADLEDQLAQVIRQFTGVHDASVDINFGEDQSYVLYSNNVVDASASVFLTMENGRMLTNEQANAIRNYVSHAVANLDVDNVVITDSIGNTYSDFSGGNAQSDSMLKLQLEEEWSNRIRTQVMQVLERAYGEGNVLVSANATVELGNKTVNSHDVTLPEYAQNGETGGRGILGSEFWAYTFTTPDGGATGGIVGTTTNADLPTNVEPGQAQAELENILAEEANRIYDNPTTDTEMIIHCGTLTDVTVAVTINTRGLVDGINVEQIRSHTAMAAGIIPVVTEEMTADEYLSLRISVLGTPFPEDEVPEPEPGGPGTLLGLPYWVFIAAGVGLLLFVIILVVVLLLLRRRKRRKQAEEQKAMEELMASAMPGQTAVMIGEDGQPIVVDGQVGPQLDENGNPVGGANVMDLNTERSMELRQDIRDFVDENMEVAALLLKSWMKEGEDNG